jgi:septum formation protein
MPDTLMKPHIILASSSPRRSELLQQVRVTFEVLSVDIDETVLNGESPETYVERLALEKARAGWELSSQACPVLGSDTVVVNEDRILGKPRDRQHALEMLTSLSGKTHRVLTAVALVMGDKSGIRLSESRVTFGPVDEQDLHRYWESGEPVDKAGAYAVQGLAAAFINRLEGSYSGVMGLPLHETLELLRSFGLDVTMNWGSSQ